MELDFFKIEVWMFSTQGWYKILKGTTQKNDSPDSYSILQRNVNGNTKRKRFFFFFGNTPNDV
jgi:hypothetical protein